MPHLGAKFNRRLLHALHRGMRWNWVYWYATIHSDEHEVLIAEVPPRLIQAIERGELTKRYVVHLLASRGHASLEVFTPYVMLWGEAISLLLKMRVDARKALLFAQVACDLIENQQWREAFEAIWRATEIERSYSNRVVKWRSLLYLITEELIRNEPGNSDPRVQSVTKEIARNTRTRHEGRRRD